jgi:hypothetical protein
MHLFRVRHMAALVSGGTAALLLAIISAGAALAGGEPVHFP